MINFYWEKNVILYVDIGEKSAFFRQANKRGSKNKVGSIGEVKKKEIIFCAFFPEGTV